MPESKPGQAAKPISQLVADPDFPNSAVGERVEIRGYTGVVVELVRNSLKVRSDEGDVVSYNFHALRNLYGPRPAPENSPSPEEPVKSPASEPEPKQKTILEPDFNAPLVPIESLVHRPEFPICALGLFVDLHGFTGVVVDLVGSSLKIRPREGLTRSYNAEGLKKLYAKSKAAG